MNDFDQELQRRLRRYRETRNAADFWEVVLHVERKFARYFNYGIFNHADAQDVFQDFVIHVFENRDVVDPDRKPLAWMFRVAYRRKVDFLRRRGLWQERFEQFGDNFEELFASEHRIVEELLRREADGRTRERLKTLDDRDRELVELHWMQGKTQNQTADALGRSPKSIKNRVERLMVILQDVLDDDEGKSDDEDHT